MLPYSAGFDLSNLASLRSLVGGSNGIPIHGGPTMPTRPATPNYMPGSTFGAPSPVPPITGPYPVRFGAPAAPVSPYANLMALRAFGQPAPMFQNQLRFPQQLQF